MRRKCERRYMTDWHDLTFSDEGQPNRVKAALVGVVGGLVGAYALRLYWRVIAPAVFPPQADPDNHDVNPAHSISLAGKHYLTGESAPAAVGRLVYDQVVGEAPDTAVREQLETTMPLVMGAAAGLLYGGTRTTTRARDIAGGFFYGLRLWQMDTFGAALLGLRPGPKAYSRSQHLWRLAGVWVYSFTTTAVTRVLYRLL